MRRATHPRVVIVAALLVAMAVGCGGDGETQLTVFGASSLVVPLTGYGSSFPGVEVRTSFAGSGQLAAQIRQGARPDVFAAADTSHPWRLHREGLVERPTAFASNRLVIAVPAGSEISSIAALARDGTKIVIGDPGVPVGAYARDVLSGLPARQRNGILANVRSEEPEVSSVVAKLVGGSADAGFVYATDVRTVPPGSLRAIPIPESLQPNIVYAAAVTRDAPHPAAAQRYLAGLRASGGAAELRRAGFGPPP